MKHLRELAKDFAQGKISQDAYRKQRTALIQGILSGNISVPDRDFLAPLPPPSDEDITSRGFEYDPLATTEIAVTKPGQKNRKNSSPSSPPPVTGPTRKQFPVWLFATLSLSVIVFILAITALFIYTTGGNSDRVAEELARTQAPEPGEAASQLISLFLQQNNWQPENLEKFEANWQKIGPNERQVAASLPVMNRLKNAIYKQILEERAMMAVGDAESARQKQQVLVEFAHRIGINDPAITVDP